MIKAYIVRHGEAQDDVEDFYGGIADFPLTDMGKQAAGEVAERLADKGIERIYASPYKRAAETAEIIGAKLERDIETVDDLRERNSYGVLSGVNKDQAKIIFKDVLSRISGKAGSYYSDDLVVGAEALEDFDQRVKSAINDIFNSAAALNSICIVTHGNVTRSIYKNIFGIDGKVDLGHLAITEIEWDGSGASILSSNGVTVE